MTRLLLLLFIARRALVQLEAAGVLGIAAGSYSHLILEGRGRESDETRLLRAEVITLQSLAARVLLRGALTRMRGIWPRRRALLPRVRGRRLSPPIIQPFERPIRIGMNLV